MRRSLMAVVLFGGAACIEIPPNIHAEFAPPRPDDASNYRPGKHGSAPPVEELGAADAAAPVAKAAGDAVADGGAP